MIIFVSYEFFKDYCESDPLAVMEAALGAADEGVFLTRLLTPFAVYHGETLDGIEFESDEISNMIEEFLVNVRNSAIFMIAENYYDTITGHGVRKHKLLVRVFEHVYEIDNKVDDVFEMSEYTSRIYGGIKRLTSV